MDDDDEEFIRELHIALGGSGTVTFARQSVYDRKEHFQASISALDKLGNHSERRPVRLEYQFEAYFMSVFACLEHITVNACGDLKEVARLSLSLADLKGGTVFDRAIKYLQLFETVDRVDKQIMALLGKYRIVRNAIAHGAGVANISGIKRETVTQLPGIGVDEESGEPRLSKDFCERFVDFAYRYITEIERITRSFGDRAKARVTSVT